MRFFSGNLGIGMAVVGIVLALAAPAARADDVRPVQILAKELPSGAWDVQWSVPKLIPPQAMPSPRMPDGSRPVGERTFIDRPSAWLTRQVYECPGGLAGRPLGIDFPLYNIGLSVLLRVEFLSGDRYARMLNPGEDSWVIPEASASGFLSFLEEARDAVVGGADHFFRGWVHLAFLLVICLLGGARERLRLVTVFLAAQVVAAMAGAIAGVRLEAPLAEIGVALATVLLAREALRPQETRKQLTILVACAGVVHGLGIQNLISLPGQDSAPEVLDSLLLVLGMDAALLVSAMVLSGLGYFAGKLPGRIRLARAAVYATAGVLLAVAIGAVVSGPAPSAKEGGERRLELPSIMTVSGTAALPGSRRVASNTPDATIQSFVAVEAFEVRHEILVRLQHVAGLAGAGAGPELAIENQSDVKDRIRELVLGRVSLEIDGDVPEPVSRRVDFMTLDEKGVLPRPEPVPELVETAWVGVTAIYMTNTVTQNLALTWEFIDAIAEIPATVTDPEFSRSTVLTPGEPVLLWENELAEDPVPMVSAIAVEPAKFTVPLWSFVPLIAALLLAIAAVRRRRPAFSFALARVMVALAILLGPFGTIAVALPWSISPAPGAGEAKRILARILPNVYRALEFREESAVFDRLALSVGGETLSQVYLDHRRVLEMEDRGGARARVEAVEVIEVDSVEPGDSGGFSARAIWTVGGTVTHFGHRHFRQNRYDARLAIVPDQGTWKLQSIEILEEVRVR